MSKDEKTVYLHVLSVPEGGVLKLAAPPDGITGVTTIAGKTIAAAEIDGDQLVIPIAEDIRDEIDTILVVGLK